MIKIWIKCENEAIRGLYVDDVMDAPVEFNDNGTAQVPKDVAESLFEQYDDVVKYDADSDAQ